MPNPQNDAALQHFPSDPPKVVAHTSANRFGKAQCILRMKQLVERTNLSRATLYVLMSSDPHFPRKIKLTARAIGFLESEVDAWLAYRANSGEMSD